MIDWVELENKLNNHDYTYQHSDDFSVWRAGVSDEESIREIIKEIVRTGTAMDNDKVLALIRKYRKSSVGTDFETEVIR